MNNNDDFFKCANQFSIEECVEFFKEYENRNSKEMSKIFLTTF